MAGCDQQYSGQQLTYSQLEGVWINNGGNPSMAPLMAAIAMAESGGNSGIVNTCDNNGTQSSWGLWQISLGNHNTPAANWNDPNVNAQLAIQKLNSQGLGAWGTYTSGAYQQYLQQDTSPSSGGTSLSAQFNPNNPDNPTGQNQTPTSPNKCVIQIPSVSSIFGGSGYCIWYDSWTHGLVGCLAIAGGGLVIWIGVLSLGLTTALGGKTGKVAIGAITGGKGGAIGGALGGGGSGGESDQQIYEAEVRRQNRQARREYYRNMLNPPKSVEEQEQERERQRLYRLNVRQAHRAQAEKQARQQNAADTATRTAAAHN